jgi:soluble lytic murein transglycosylase
LYPQFLSYADLGNWGDPMHIKQYILIAIFTLSFSMPSQSDSINEHYDYIKAETQLKNRQYQKFNKTMETELADHPLKHYLTAEWIRTQFYRKPIPEIDAFLKRFKDQPPANKLNNRWLAYLARKQEWELFLYYYTPTQSLVRQCQRITALESTNNQFEAISDGQALWLKGVPLPKQCDTVFNNWRRIGYLSQDLIWERLMNAQTNRHGKLVSYLKKQLSKDTLKQFKVIQSAWRRPGTTFTDKRLLSLNVSIRNTLLARAIKRFPNYWLEMNSNPIFSSLNQSQLDKLEVIAITSGAKQKDKKQFYWYQLAIQNNLLTEDLQKTFLQGAVQSQNWPLYSHLYKLSPSTIKDAGKWLYWRARSLELMGAHRHISHSIYRVAADFRNYYGFLASQQLGISASMNHNPTKVEASVMQKTRIQPNVKRALALLDLNRISGARREWQLAFDNLDQAGRQALALLAGRLEWSDRSIMTLAKLKDWHDLQLRFPLAHEPLFDQAAKRSNIEKTWIYGIARQESAFMYDVRSHVGATGLMQLMPATAKGVSKRLRLKYSKHKLIDPNYNVRLGSHYLKMLLKRYKGNRVLATAAYNAGPSNVNRWLKRFDGPLDIWIENIPFNETKQYVQRVMAYSTIYSYRLGGLQPLFDLDTLDSWHHQSDEFLTASKSDENETVLNSQG